MKAPFLVLPLIALAACATTKDSAQDGKEQANQSRKMQRTNDCMFQSTINGFNALDDRYVILYGMGRKQAYLAELAPGCFQITSKIALGAVDGDNNGQICGFGRDSLSYREFGRTEECRITSLERLSELRLYEVTGQGPPTPKDKDPAKKKEEDKPPEDDDGE
jgi:hypothetical protein